MTLNFQNKIVFPAPASSYTSETAYGQVIYIPRNILSNHKKGNVFNILDCDKESELSVNQPH